VLNSSTGKARPMVIFIGLGAIACAIFLGLMVLHHAGGRPPVGDASMRALLCILVALLATKLIREGLGRRGVRLMFGALLLIYVSVAAAIFCLLWLGFSS